MILVADEPGLESAPVPTDSVYPSSAGWTEVWASLQGQIFFAVPEAAHR